MSFGFGVGDFLAVGKLAWTVYTACQSAPESFGNIAQEVQSLHAVLEGAEDVFVGQTLSAEQKFRCETILDGCTKVLRDLETLVKKYQQLGNKRKVLWNGIKWGTEDIQGLRSRLISNIVLLNIFLSSSQPYLKKILSEYTKEVQDGKCKDSVASSRTAEALSTNDETWNMIRNELEESGITSTDLDNNKALITSWFKASIGAGVFRRQPTQNSTQGFAVITLEIHVYQYPRELHVPHFVKRHEKCESLDKELTRVRANADGPQVVILLGMGGSGKTQLALEYCRQAEAKKKFDAIFWVDASSPITLTQSFALITDKIYGAKQLFVDSDSTVACVKRTLRGCTSTWLMVFDNFDRPDTFSKPMSSYWPDSAAGAVLFTSRHEASMLLGTSIEISGMSEEEGINLLVNRIGRAQSKKDGKSLQKIVSMLGNLALAIDQAGAYIILRHLELADYPALYRARKKKLLEEIPNSSLWYYSRKRSTEAPSESALSVFTTWEMSYESLTGDSEQQRMKILLLTLAAFLGNEGISEDMFRRYAESVESLPNYMAQLAPGGSWDKFEFREIITEFKNLSMLQSLTHGSSGIHFSLHPLVRDWAQLRISPALQTQLTIDATTLVSLSLPDPDGRISLDVPIRDQWRFLQHMDDCVRNCENYLTQDDWPGVGRLTEPGYRFATFYSYVGGTRQDDAEKILHRAIKWRSDERVPVDARTVLLVLRLAWVHENQQRHRACKDLSTQALEMSQKYLSEEDPAAWLVQRRIGLVHYHEQHMDEAEKSLQKCYGKQRQGLGMEHQATLCTIQDLASIYTAELKLDKAEEYAKIAIQGRISISGRDAPTCLTAQRQLAIILIKRREFKAAESLLLELLMRAESIFGSSSHHVVNIKDSLADTYRHQNRYLEAIRLSTEKKTIRENIYGIDSVPATFTLVELARTYIEYARRGGDGEKLYEDAECLLVQAKAAFKAVGGPDTWEHLQWVTLWLSKLYFARQDYDKAEALSSEVLADSETSGSPISYKDLLWGAYFVYATQEKKAEMSKMLERALSVTKRMMGPGNMQMLPYIERAQTGYSILNHPEGMDRWSCELLCLWYEAGGSCYNELKIDETLAANAMKVPLPSSLTSVCNALWSWSWNGDTRVDERFLALAAALIHVEDEVNRLIACERLLSRQAYKNGLPQLLWFCDWCQVEGIIGTIHQCKSCAGCALCYDCFSRYNTLQTPLVNTECRPKIKSCIRHDFLKIPREGWSTLPLETVDEKGQTVNDWILKVRDMYGNVKYPSDIEDVIGYAEITVQL